MKKFKYWSWEVDLFKKEASRIFQPEKDLVTVKLASAQGLVQHEGWWPSPPINTEATMISGICLWDARWQIEFEQIDKSNPPARRSIALPASRAQAIKKIFSGRKARAIYCPLALGCYHHALIDWQMRKIKKLKPIKVLYHLPIKEYHEHICEIEVALSRSLDFLHSELDEFSGKLKSYMISAFGEEIMAKIEFISGYSAGAKNSIESYVFPYKYPEKFGVNRDEIYGVEDLNEMKLSYMSLSQEQTRFIPVLCGVIGADDPYYLTQDLIEIKSYSINNMD